MQKKYKILIHTRSSGILEELGRLSGERGYEYIPLPDVSNLILSVYDEMPHLVLVDLRRANVGGFETCKQLKSDAILEHIPLIVLTDLTEASELPDSGADQTLSRDEPIAGIWNQIREMIDSSTHALDTHPLTRLPGSRSSIERIESVIQKGESFAICAIHVRRLGQYYRTFGQSRGDALARGVMNLFTEICGGLTAVRGFIGHLGDRDFVVILPPDRAVEFAEQVIERFESRLGRASGSSAEAGGENMATLSIAIVTNEKVPLHHIAEFA